MGVRDNFVYSKKDVMVAGVAAAIVVVMLGLGFGLTTGASLPGMYTHIVLVYSSFNNFLLIFPP